MTTDYRDPPHNFEAEQVVLGAIMLDGSAYERVSEYLRRDHFAEPTYGHIFAAAGLLYERGDKISPITLIPLVKDRLSALGEPVRYLADLCQACPSPRLADSAARQIVDLHLRREGIAICEQSMAEFYDTEAGDGAGAVFERMEHRSGQVTEVVTGDDRTVDQGASVQATIRQIEEARKARARGEIVGVTTGLEDLDRQTGGLRRSDLVILAGRPSMGKTALALGIARGAAKAGRSVLFASLEMSHEQLTQRGIASDSGVSSSVLERGECDDRQFEAAVLAGQEMARQRLYIDDTPAMTPQGLRTRARRIKRRHGLDMIVVDYLQLMRLPDRTENRVQELSKITASLKALAKELDVPVLALSQLSRGVEMREDKRPQLSDLRESGSIEQDADVVMFVYREEYYLDREQPAEGCPKYSEKMTAWNDRKAACANTAEVIIAKQRRGAVGTVRLHFQAELTKFSNLGRGY